MHQPRILPTQPCHNTPTNLAFHIALAQPNDSDDNIDVADRTTRASTAVADEDASLVTTVVPPAARFCSADACSVRKDVTRRARRLMPSPSAPSAAELEQQVDPVTALRVDAATRVEVEEGG